MIYKEWFSHSFKIQSILKIGEVKIIKKIVVISS